eukprot:maker-scaffold114_size351134-snap-gene-1.11 protein:Tk09544 transcript:maker-scaffold114_size351134-snap-gene-1.11-mRNA-1 annotation:"ixoderin precursor "
MGTDCTNTYTASPGILSPGVQLNYLTLDKSGFVEELYCDRGWTVIMRRGQYGNPLDYFNRPMSDYISGFGDLMKEFWIGLDKLYTLTQQNENRLRIQLWDNDYQYREANYKVFKVLRNTTYTLQVEGFSSPANAFVLDGFGFANGSRFTAKDNDQDGEAGQNCAQILEGPGWFGQCQDVDANLFGPNHNQRSATSRRSLFWQYFQGPTNSLAKVVMSIAYG